ncbi:MAG: ABC transporter permease subunit [Acidobacteria bacterium]|nr:ABC transporter permease subunit [Acidobacteriota bacterium]
MKGRWADGVALGFLLLLLAGWMGGGDGQVDLVNRLQAPSWTHPFGTDELGRDLLRRWWAGGARSLSLGAGLTAFHLAAGFALALAAEGRTWAKGCLLAGADLLAAIPATLLALLLLALLRPGLGSLLAALALGGWIPYARICLNRLEVLRQDPSLAQAHLLGAGRGHILLRHLFPRLWPLLWAQASVGLGAVVLVEGGLSFLGVGLPPEQASWGGMLGTARAFFLVSPWPLLWPSAGLLGLLLALGRSRGREPGW